MDSERNTSRRSEGQPKESVFSADPSTGINKIERLLSAEADAVVAKAAESGDPEKMAELAAALQKLSASTSKLSKKLARQIERQNRDRALAVIPQAVGQETKTTSESKALARFLMNKGNIKQGPKEYMQRASQRGQLRIAFDENAGDRQKTIEFSDSLRETLGGALEKIQEGERQAKQNNCEREVEAMCMSCLKEGLGEFIKGLPLKEGENYEEYLERIEKKLSYGLRGNWLHYLLRADILFKTYFHEQSGLAELSQGLELAADKLRKTIKETKNLRLGPQIKLLSPLSKKQRDELQKKESISFADASGKKATMVISPAYFNALVKIDSVKEKVLAFLNENKGQSPCLVDISGFPFEHSGTCSPGRMLSVGRADVER